MNNKEEQMNETSAMLPHIDQDRSQQKESTKI